MLERGEHLTISTAHLTGFDASNIGDVSGVFTKGEYGFYVHVSAIGLGPHTAFNSLRECVCFALRHDFSILIFDRDGHQYRNRYPLHEETQMSEWFKDQRQAFIDATLAQFGQINREDIMREFGVSVALASSDISTYLASAKRSVRYDVSAKLYTTDALCSRPGKPERQCQPSWTVIMMKPSYWRGDEASAADEAVRLWVFGDDPESAVATAYRVLPANIEGVGTGEGQAHPDDFAPIAVYPGHIKDLYKGDVA